MFNLSETVQSSCFACFRDCIGLCIILYLCQNISLTYLLSLEILKFKIYLWLYIDRPIGGSFEMTNSCIHVTLSTYWQVCDYKVFNHCITALFWWGGCCVSPAAFYVWDESVFSQLRLLSVMGLCNMQGGNLIQSLRNSTNELAFHRYIVLLNTHQLLSTFPTEAPSGNDLYAVCQSLFCCTEYGPREEVKNDLEWQLVTTARVFGLQNPNL